MKSNYDVDKYSMIKNISTSPVSSFKNIKSLIVSAVTLGGIFRVFKSFGRPSLLRLCRWHMLETESLTADMLPLITSSMHLLIITFSETEQL